MRLMWVEMSVNFPGGIEVLFKVFLAIGVISTAWYMVENFFFIKLLSKNQKLKEGPCGSFELFSINSQVKYLKMIFSLGKDSLINFSIYKARVIRIRALFIVMFIAYILIFCITGWK